MSLPPAEELARWTVGHVNKWLTESSLTAFRDDFLREGIDGNKLLRMQPRDIDTKYNFVTAKKRQVLKDHLSRIESTPRVMAAPQLPPRPGREPTPIPQEQDDGDASDDGGWSDDFNSEGSDDDDYLQPSTPAHIQHAAPGHKLNGHHRGLPPEDPQAVYEIAADDFEEERSPRRGIQRRSTILDRLKNELEIRKRESQARMQLPSDSDSDADEPVYIEPVACLYRAPQDNTPPPPPRPPRMDRPAPERPSYMNSHAHQPPPPPPVAAAAAPQLPKRPVQHAPENMPRDDVYEIMNDESESSVGLAQQKPAAQRHSREVPLPPKPVKKASTEKPPQQGGWVFNHKQATPPAPPPVAAAAPATPEDELSAFEWYHGKISRDHAQTIFSREQKDGMYLIRKSERDPQQPYTLVIWHCNRIWNIPIRKVVNNKFAAGKYKEGETHFDGIPDLIEHFKVVSLNLKSDSQVQGTHNLTVPAPRRR
ncbi:uncharacterized protein LOC143293882 isoform X3 [Babylonia areolata]|uniref:uncharacterized protein LOC143293882 isoform X3 n=1 Tax=Babylonia areolata TaxID=304850 RepID=UPI003FD24961